MSSDANNHSAKRKGHHPSKSQEIRKSLRSGASLPKVLSSHPILATMIRLGRVELGWTQEIFATKSTYDTKTIENVENGRTEKPETLRVLRELLRKELEVAKLRSLEELWKANQSFGRPDEQKKQNEKVLRRIDDLREMLSKALMSQQRDPVKEGNARLDVLETWATRYGLTLKEAEDIIERFIADTRSDPNVDTKSNADAEFLAQNFLKAAELYMNSAREALCQLEKKEAGFQQEKLRLKETAVRDLLHAGESFFEAGKYPEALKEFEEALTHVDRKLQTSLWVLTEEWHSIVAGILCFVVRSNRTESQAMAGLERLTAAYRAVLEIITLERQPQDWAMTQFKLAGALTEQAERSYRAQLVELLAEMEKRYYAMDEVSREQHPQYWATTQKNLANIRKEQASRGKCAETLRLIHEAIQSYENTLKVWTAEQSQLHQMSQNHLAKARARLQKFEQDEDVAAAVP